MASWTTLDDDSVTGDTLVAAIQELEGRTNELRAHAISVAAAAGDVRLNTSGALDFLEVYCDLGSGNAWQPIGPLNRVPADINLDPDPADGRAAPYQIKALRIENGTTLPAVTTGNKGLVRFNTNDGEVYVADFGVSVAWKGLLSVVKDASYDTQELELSGDLGNDGTNPPTKTTIGVLQGWLFDATNEKRTFAFTMPKNWNGASDAKLRLHQVLDAAETAGDDIEWSGEVRVLASQADKVTKTATALAASTKDIGADTEGIDAGGGPHVNELVLDFDDATNPLSAAALILVTVWRTTVGGAGKVAGVLVYRADLAYVQKPRHERA